MKDKLTIGRCTNNKDNPHIELVISGEKWVRVYEATLTLEDLAYALTGRAGVEIEREFLAEAKK